MAPTQKVTPVSPPIIITNQVSDDNARICEDFPPGFEGQTAEKGKFARQLQEIDDGLAKFEDMEGIDLNAISLPYKDSNTLIPFDFAEKDVTQNYLFLATCDLSTPINVHMSAAFPIKDIPKTQETYLQVPHPPGPKWTRVPRTAAGVSEVLDVHARNKRGSHSALNHPGLLKKSKLVSQDEQENSSRLAEAGSQPRQGPWVFYVGTVVGLRTGGQFKSLEISSEHKIPQLCSWPKHGWMKLGLVLFGILFNLGIIMGFQK